MILFNWLFTRKQVVKYIKIDEDDLTFIEDYNYCMYVIDKGNIIPTSMALPFNN